LRQWSLVPVVEGLAVVLAGSLQFVQTAVDVVEFEALASVLQYGSGGRDSASRRGVLIVENRIESLRGALREVLESAETLQEASTTAEPVGILESRSLKPAVDGSLRSGGRLGRLAYGASAEQLP